MRRNTLIGLTMALALLGAAFSSDDSGSDSASDTTSSADGGAQSTDDDDDGGGGGDSGDCPSDPFTGTISQDADDEGNAGADLTDGDVVLAEAFALSAGSSYTVYLADYDLGDQEIGGDTIEAAAGQVVVTLNPSGTDGGDLEVGTAYDMTFTIFDSGRGASGNASNAEGSITVLGVSDSHFCFDIDYSDDAASVKGTVSAEVVGGF
jgi:hypothetical protein